MNSQQKNPGYIMIMSLMMISAAVVMVTYLFSRGSIYVPYASTMIKREKARMLAVGGIQVALAQLAVSVEKDEKKQQPAGQQKTVPTQDDDVHSFLKRIFPFRNRWQEFELKESVDGVDGVFKMCLVSEQGKININEVFDFQQKKFRGDPQKGDWSKILEDLFKRIERHSGGKNLFSALQGFLKKQERKLEDVTQLLTIKEFEIFKGHQFYEPPEGGDAKKDKRPLYLTDLFTVHSGSSELEPWLLSDSLSGALGLDRVVFGDTKKQKGELEKIIPKIKKSADWPKEWNTILKPFYGRDLQSLPKGIESMFSSTFEPSRFAVLCYATVDQLTQRVYAIVTRRRHADKDVVRYEMKIKKLYWL